MAGVNPLRHLRTMLHRSTYFDCSWHFLSVVVVTWGTDEG